MPRPTNTFFHFKQFTIHQDACAMKVTTDACLFGAWAAEQIYNSSLQGTLSPADYALDIGSGTSLISLMLAQKNADLIIDGLEIDPAAARQGLENIAASPWSSRVHIMVGDAKYTAFAKDQNYKVIVSNPPFYENELTGADEKKNLAHHESGLLLEDLLEIIKDLLEEKGRFYLLLPYKRHQEIGQLLARFQLSILRKIMVKQSTQHGYFRLMVEGSHYDDAIVTTTEEIAITGESGYTPEFTSLLKDYYLHL